MKKKSENEFYINHILNITIVDDYLNKREIGALAPSRYMTKFKKTNPELQETMQTHLIGDLDEFGVWDNNYNKFFEERAKLVSKMLKKRIIHQEIDNNNFAVLPDEQEEDIE